MLWRARNHSARMESWSRSCPIGPQYCGRRSKSSCRPLFTTRSNARIAASNVITVDSKRDSVPCADSNATTRHGDHARSRAHAELLSRSLRTRHRRAPPPAHRSFVHRSRPHHLTANRDRNSARVGRSRINATVPSGVVAISSRMLFPRLSSRSGRRLMAILKMMSRPGGSSSSADDGRATTQDRRHPRCHETQSVMPPLCPTSKPTGAGILHTGAFRRGRSDRGS